MLQKPEERHCRGLVFWPHSIGGLQPERTRLHRPLHSKHKCAFIFQLLDKLLRSWCLRNDKAKQLGWASEFARGFLWSLGSISALTPWTTPGDGCLSDGTVPFETCISWSWVSPCTLSSWSFPSTACDVETFCFTWVAVLSSCMIGFPRYSSWHPKHRDSGLDLKF